MHLVKSIKCEIGRNGLIPEKRKEYKITAMAYIEEHGDRAFFKIRDDISREIGLNNWSEAHRLQCVRLDIRKFQVSGQLFEKLTAEKKASYSAT